MHCACRFAQPTSSLHARCRYTPLLAYLLLPNITLHPAFGKLLFAAADIAAALLLHRLIARKLQLGLQMTKQSASHGGVRSASGALTSSTGVQGAHGADGVKDAHLPRLAMTLWLFNPYTATISTRGSSDSLVVLMQLVVLSLLQPPPPAPPPTPGSDNLAARAAGHDPVSATLNLMQARFTQSLSRYDASLARAPPQASRRKFCWALDASAGSVFGLLVHWRLFPVLYGPCLLVFLHYRAHERVAVLAPVANAAPSREPASHRSKRPSGLAATSVQVVQCRTTRTHQRWLRDCLAFGMPALAVFFGLGALFHRLYGQQFVHESFLYHASRRDPRHNFAPHFLLTYLRHYAQGADGLPASEPAELPVWLDANAAALPCCAAAVVAIALKFGRHLDCAFLLTTLTFVTFNKVSTAQYFVWYFGLAPAALPELRSGWGRLQLAAALAWVAAQLAWLAAAYQLEFQVRNCNASAHELGLRDCTMHHFVCVYINHNAAQRRRQRTRTRRLLHVQSLRACLESLHWT